jgi:HSP20 family protein
MAKINDDKKTVVYRFYRNYHDLARGMGEEKVHDAMVDIYETKDFLRVEVELPGVKKEDLEVYTIGDRLFVHALKREELLAEAASQRREFLCMEREFGEFKREIELSVSCNVSAGKARMEDGVLIVEFPKLADRRGQRIDLPIE